MADHAANITRQPFKAFYVLYYVCATLISLPAYLLWYARPANRPRRGWSYQAAAFNYITKVIFDLQARIEMKTTVSLEPGKDKENFESIQPAPQSILRKPLTGTTIQPTVAGGLWLPQRYQNPSTDSSRILLHFHGGAYVVLTPREAFAQWGPKMLCTELPAAAAFSLQYRLASNPHGSFPAQLQDAIAAYWHLVKEKNINPSRIVLSGDSSGAHLAISLLRYLTENRDLLPLPQAALLHHPWLNLTDDGTSVRGANAGSDYLTTHFLRWGARSFIPSGMDARDAYVSPFFHPFASEVPIWVQAGTAEFLHRDIAAWVAGMQAITGNRVAFHEQPDAMHSTFAIGDAVGMADKARAGARSARDFLGRMAG